MKKNDFALKAAAGLVALGIMAAAASAFADSVPQVVQVVKVVGSAQFSSDGRTWSDLSGGEVLKPGITIRTAEKSYVDILLGSAGSAGGAFSGPNLLNIPGGGGSGAGAGGGGGSGTSGEIEQANVVRIFQNTFLAVDKLTLDRTGVDEVSDTQLDLRAGQIMGNVKKLSQQSHYEIKIPNGVAGIRGTPFIGSSVGMFGVLKGPGLDGGKATVSFVLTDGSLSTVSCGPGEEIRPNPPHVEPIPADQLAAWVNIFNTLSSGGGPPGPATGHTDHTCQNFCAIDGTP
jgi:FecR protein